MNRGMLAVALVLTVLGCKNESTTAAASATASALPTPSASTPSTPSASVASPQPSEVPWRAGACKTASDCFAKEAPPNDATWVCDNGQCVRRSTRVP